MLVCLSLSIATAMAASSIVLCCSYIYYQLLSLGRLIRYRIYIFEILLKFLERSFIIFIIQIIFTFVYDHIYVYYAVNDNPKLPVQRSVETFSTFYFRKF